MPRNRPAPARWRSALSPTLLAMLTTAITPSASLAQTGPAPSGAGHLNVERAVYGSAPTRSGEKEMVVDLYRGGSGPVKGAVVLLHGGGFTGGSRDLQENVDYGEALARRGYLVAAASYRLHGDAPVVDGWAQRYAEMARNHGDPRIVGQLQQLGPGFADAVAAAAVDAFSVVAWLREHARELQFDPEDIALFGASAGAITALTAVYAMDEYDAPGLDVAAVVDLRGLLLIGPVAANPFRAGDPPLLLLHGEDDRRVPLSDAETVFALAKEAGTAVQLFSVPGAGHELGGRALLELEVENGRTVLDHLDEFVGAAFAARPAGGSLRGRLRRVDVDRDVASIATPASAPRADAVLRTELAAAVAGLVSLVRSDPGVVASLYGLSKSEALEHAFDDLTRLDWSYWPRTRRGLAIGQMSATQRRQTHAILEAFLSAKGYLQVNHIMMLEEVLASIESDGFLRGSEDYLVSVFGAPSDGGRWGLRFEGHHVSLNVTVGPDRIHVTPSFLGASPVPIPAGMRAGFNPLRYEQSYAYDLLESLDDSQRTAAILAREPPLEVLTSQFRVDSTEWDSWPDRLARDGVLASTFDREQMARLRRLIMEILGVYRPEIGIAWLDTLDLRTLAFAWMGSSQRGQPHYYRIQGRDFVFELDSAQEDGAHVHTVWRDRSHDFGGDALRAHYRSSTHHRR